MPNARKVIRTIDQIDFTKEGLEEEYYNCIFNKCDFHEQKVLNTKFENCKFFECNFSLAVISCAVFDTLFENCHMLGCDLSSLNAFSGGLQFKKCTLNYADFSNIRMKGMKFKGCSMLETSFDNARLKNSSFDECNMERATFDGADLSQSDFVSSYNFTINPNNTILQKSRFSKDQLEGLVAHLGIVVV